MRHHRHFALSILAASSLANVAAPLVSRWDDIRVKHTWGTVPPNWETLGHPPFNTTIDLHIALLLEHENALIDALYEVSTPKHSKYGKHMSKEQVALLVAPHRDTLELINSWLNYHRIPPSSVSVTHGGSWLTVAAVPVSQANEMLGASYQLYRQSGTNDTILRTIGYALPAVLHKHVLTVVPTTYFASTHTGRQTLRGRSVGATEDVASREPGTIMTKRINEVNPSQLRWLYRTFAYTPHATDKNKLGVVGYAKDYPNPADLKQFMTKYRTTAADAATYSVVRVNGGKYKPNRPTFEANQNIQYAKAMVYPTPVTFYSVGGGFVVTPGSNEPGPGDAMLEWFNYVNDLPDDTVPKTMSTSYGKYEKDLPLEYATALCRQFAQLGTRGISVLFPSGNEGVGEGDCKASDGSVQFIPEFPASCPYVTSVGGTTGGTDQNLPGLTSEIAAALSGGGFSNYFERPPYQKDVVPAFLEKLGSQYANMYNADGRGIPDISSQALNFVYILGNTGFITDGTSSATPTAAGVISLLNDYLLSTDRPPLGFLNPMLYGHLLPAMNDIKSGSNPGCKTKGFSATPGWDPVTGLGTPDFLNLQALRDLMDIY